MTKDANKEKNTIREIHNTWFWKYVINNRLVSIFFILLLMFLTIFMFNKISHLFVPIVSIFSIVGPPLIFSILIYYLLIPIVRYLEKKKVPKKGAIWIVFIGIIILISFAINYLIPVIQLQINELIANFPTIWKSVNIQIEQILQNKWLSDLYNELQLNNLFAEFSTRASNLLTMTIGSIGNVVGYITKISITLFTIPFVLYYLLAEGPHFKKSILMYTPIRYRQIMKRFLNEASHQIGSYVRGELLVAVGVSFIFYIGYRIIGLEYALLLSIIAGMLNLIPYLGSIISAIPAMIIGAFISPIKFFQVVVILIIEQTIEGRVISPQILGNKLDIHPFIILFILLISGSLFGFMGLVLAVPGFGIIRILWNIFFDWFNKKYNLYEE